MKKSILALAVSFAFCMAAQATNFGDTNNNQTYNNPVANGGQGGTANADAVALAGAIATGGNSSATGGSSTSTANGGSVIGSGNSSNKIDNENTNTNAQGQQQGQQQTSTSGVKNSGNSSSKSSTENANNSSQSVTVQGDSYEAQKRDPVATAYSNLAAPSAPCMGSSSVGAQGVGFGLSVGSTWTSEDCNNREDIRAAYNYGDKAVAEEMLSMNVKGYAAAKKRVADRKAGKTVQATATEKASVRVANNGYTGDDPIVRARLGLPPLK